MNAWNFLFRKYHVRTRCNIIDYRDEGREGGRGKERGRKEAMADQNQTKERGKGEREGKMIITFHRTSGRFAGE